MSDIIKGGQIVIFDRYSTYAGKPYQAVIVKPNVYYHGGKYCLMQGQSLFWAPYPEKKFWDKDRVCCPFAGGNMLYRLDGMIFDSSPKAMKFLDMFGYLMPDEDYRLFLPNGAMLRDYPEIKQAMQDEITENVGYLYLTSYGDYVSYCSTSGTQEFMSYKESMAPLGFAPVFLIDEQAVKKAKKDIHGRPVISPVIREWRARSLDSLFSCLA